MRQGLFNRINFPVWAWTVDPAASISKSGVVKGCPIKPSCHFISDCLLRNSIYLFLRLNSLILIRYDINQKNVFALITLGHQEIFLYTFGIKSQKVDKNLICKASLPILCQWSYLTVCLFQTYVCTNWITALSKYFWGYFIALRSWCWPLDLMSEWAQVNFDSFRTVSRY